VLSINNPAVLQLLDAICVGHKRLTQVHKLKEFDNDLSDRPSIKQYRRDLVNSMRRLADEQSADYPNDEINDALFDVVGQLKDVTRLRTLSNDEVEAIFQSPEGDRLPIWL
jgi:hypothetical protein